MDIKYFPLYLLILLNFSYQANSDNYIIIPLHYAYNDNSINNYIEFLLQPQLYGEIKFGNPEHSIYLLISTESTYFSIESKYFNEKFYDFSKSSTFINTTKKVNFYNEIYKSSYICKDQFYFINDINTMKEEPYQNMSFYYVNEISNEYSQKLEKYYINKNKNKPNGIIGLKLPDSFSSGNNILKYLNNIKAISKNIWSLYMMKSNLYLIFGKDLYKEQYNEVKRTTCYGSGYYNYWYFLFNDIMIGNNKLNDERTAEYSPQIGVIIGVKEYQNYLKKYFFASFIEKNICNEEKLNLNGIIYNYYVCYKDINLNSFESIEFIHEELSYKFILDKNDLFMDYGNKKLFLCIFIEYEKGYSSYSTNHWILGLPFVKKYNFVFDEDSKNILFYDKKSIYDNYFNRDSGVIYWIIVIILFLFAGVLFIYLIIKIIYKPKQIKANELEESFSYKINENLKNKDILDSIYNSKYNNLGI